jgi:hypothetical protein
MMTKDNIFKQFIEDPLLVEKGYFTKDQIDKIRFIDRSGNKLIEVIKMAINGNVDGETEGVTNRKINQFLNK